MDTIKSNTKYNATVDDLQSRPNLLSLAFPMIILFIPMASFFLFIVVLVLGRLTGLFFFFGYLFEFVIFLSIFSVRYIAYPLSTLFSVFGVILFFMIALNVIYFSFACLKGKLRYAPIALLLVATSISAFEFRPYARECVTNFHRVESYKGQTLSFEKLQAECGEPAFYREQGNISHWGYTDGSRVLPVYILDTGEAKVSETTYWLFD